MSHDYIRTLAEIERAYIYEILVSRAWKVTLAAQDLGISRATVYRKIKEYDLVSPFI